MGIGDLGCDTPDYQHVWDYKTAWHKVCRICRREEIDHELKRRLVPATIDEKQL
jgi:hypothetical protein